MKLIEIVCCTALLAAIALGGCLGGGGEGQPTPQQNMATITGAGGTEPTPPSAMETFS